MTRTWEQICQTAANFGARLDRPQWNDTAESMERELNTALAEGEIALGKIAAQASQPTFEDTVGALDRLSHHLGYLMGRLTLIQYAHPDSTLREGASRQIMRAQDWALGILYREDVFKALAAFEAKGSRLEPEQKLLLEESLRDFRRAGMGLSPEARAEVQKLKTELQRWETEFGDNIREAKAEITFTREELEGLPETFLTETQGSGGKYLLQASIYYHTRMVLENAVRPATRRAMNIASGQVAQEKNGPLLDRILERRALLAQKLGYASWAHYQIELKMAAQPERVKKFLEDLSQKLEPKFESELAHLQKLKALDLKQPAEATSLESWDVGYYKQKLLMSEYKIDTQALRSFFPYDAVKQGVFKVYEDLLSLTFERLKDAPTWEATVELYVACDRSSGEPLGLLYLDPFPRPGKFNHFAHFTILEARTESPQARQRPASALLCNFPQPSGDQPALLTHDDVETFFHEFGHALHGLVTRAQFSRFAGTSVKGDFVEVPSQILEAWALDYDVLNRFAHDYRDPHHQLPRPTLERLKESKRATSALSYRRQIALALSDLAFHAEGARRSADTLYREIHRKHFIEPPSGTHGSASWGHLVGYDGGYYGYAWADVIQADMRNVFEEAPGGLMDAHVGKRFRQLVLEPGGSLPPDTIIQNFIGRPWNERAFLKEIGLAA